MTERTGWRDKAYSDWHRADSIGRFIPRADAESLGLIDLDWCEYCRTCRYPIALFELTCDWSKPKQFSVTRTLAQMARIQVFLVYYRRDDTGDIVEFAIGNAGGEILTPADYARWLVEIRDTHRCGRRLEVAS